MNIIPYLLANIRFEHRKEIAQEALRDGVVIFDSELESNDNTESVPIYTRTSEDSCELAKDMIERRYRRLSTTNRRPSLEYISSEDVLHIFLKFVENKDALLQMTKTDLQDLYDKWYTEIYKPSLIK